MLVVQHTEHFRVEFPCLLTIGTFDGVHLGHQKILNRLTELKKQLGLKTVVFTFEPHPRKVLYPEQSDLKLLTDVNEKLELLEKYGVDLTVVYPFNKSFSELDSEAYVKDVLKKHLNVKYLVIGYDHRFGQKRSGDINTLKFFSTELDFEVEEISPLDVDSIAVSSSKIRRAVENGRVEYAIELLGHPYFLKALVVKGKQLGRTIGYPTANLETETVEKLIPKHGVYFVRVEINDSNYFGMMSIGTNPTTDKDNGTKLEVHIFEFNQDLYGITIKVSFLSRIRDEKKFQNLTELKNAISQDEKKCKELMLKTTSSH